MNHGISDLLINELYKYVQQFFSLPLVQKKTYELVELAGQRGYTSFGKEHTKGSKAADLFERIFSIRSSFYKKFLRRNFPNNVPVKEIKHFNKTFTDAYIAFFYISGVQ